MHQHCISVFTEDITEMRSVIIKRHFCLCRLSNYLSALSFMQNVLSVVIHSCLNKSQIKAGAVLSVRQDCLLFPVVLRCECLMRPAAERIQKMASPGLGCSSCHNVTNGWVGQNNHSNWDLRLPKALDLPDHYPSVTQSSCSYPVWVRA